MLYPSGLVMGKAVRAKDYNNNPVNTLEYTKHYYVGSERVSSKTGTIDQRYEQTILEYFPDKICSGSLGFTNK